MALRAVRIPLGATGPCFNKILSFCNCNLHCMSVNRSQSSAFSQCFCVALQKVAVAAVLALGCTASQQSPGHLWSLQFLLKLFCCCYRSSVLADLQIVGQLSLAKFSLGRIFTNCFIMWRLWFAVEVTA